MAVSGDQATLEKRPARRAPRAQPVLRRRAVRMVDAARISIGIDKDAALPEKQRRGSVLTGHA
jgi:hypothetical protein